MSPPVAVCGHAPPKQPGARPHRPMARSRIAQIGPNERSHRGKRERLLGQHSREATSPLIFELDGRRHVAMDGYIVEIDQVADGFVVLTVPALRLLVIGLTMDEATARARAAIAFRLQEAGRRSEPVISLRGQVVGASPDPATDSGLFQAPGRCVPASCDASGIAGPPNPARPAGTMPPTLLNSGHPLLTPAHCYADLAHVRRFIST
jgi:hypothetical protein